MLRSGEGLRAADVNGEGDGWRKAGVLLCDDGCRANVGMMGPVLVADPTVGIACGVDAAEFVIATEIGVGVCREAAGTGCW